jgi:hypothetical protein
MLATIFISVFALLLGLAICFVGYRLFLVFLPIWGFFAGLYVGALGTSTLFGEGFLADISGLVVGVTLGLITGILSYLFYLVGFVIVAGVIGWLAGTGLMAILGFEPGLVVTLISLAFAVGLIVLTMFFNLQKYAVIGITSILGSDLLVLSGLLLFNQVSVEQLQAGSNIVAPILQSSWVAWLIWAILAIAGILVQIQANRTFTFTRERYVEAWG